MNDVYGNLSLDAKGVSGKERMLSFLRSNSKLYLLLKKTFFDRSKTYAFHDIEFYKKRRSDIDEHLNAIVGIK